MTDRVGIVRQRVRVIVSAEDEQHRRRITVYIDGYLEPSSTAILYPGDASDLWYDLKINIVPDTNYETDPTQPEPPLPTEARRG